MINTTALSKRITNTLTALSKEMYPNVRQRTVAVKVVKVGNSMKVRVTAWGCFSATDLSRPKLVAILKEKLNLVGELPISADWSSDVVIKNVNNYLPCTDVNGKYFQIGDKLQDKDGLVKEIVVVGWMMTWGGDEITPELIKKSKLQVI